MMQTAGKPPSVRMMENRIAALETQLTDAAAFLNGLADRLQHEPCDLDAAADCRAMAERLRK